MNGRVDSSSRLINADADRIYAAFIDPVAVATWLPPSDMTGTVLAFEPKPGGVMRMELTFRHADHATPGKSSADTDIVEGYFVRLVPAQEVVQRYTFRSDDPAFAGVMTMTWSLEPEGEGTRVDFEHRGLEAYGARAEEVAKGVGSPGGWPAILDSFAEAVDG